MHSCFMNAGIIHKLKKFRNHCWEMPVGLKIPQEIPVKAGPDLEILKEA